MKTYLILPEVFITYFTSKDRGSLDKIEEIFKKAESGEMKLLITEGLFFLLASELEEIVQEKENLTDYLEVVLNLHNLKVRNEIVLRKTILEMKKGKSFIESYRAVVVPSLSLDGVFKEGDFSK
jgi:hypothetical protein